LISMSLNSFIFHLALCNWETRHKLFGPYGVTTSVKAGLEVYHVAVEKCTTQVVS
jgi:hypothetical protein